MLLGCLGRRRRRLPRVPSRTHTCRTLPARSATGQALTEYALMIVLVAVVVIPVIQLIVGVFMAYYEAIIVAAAGG